MVADSAASTHFTTQTDGGSAGLRCAWRGGARRLIFRRSDGARLGGPEPLSHSRLQWYSFEKFGSDVRTYDVRQTAGRPSVGTARGYGRQCFHTRRENSNAGG
jgi:hypothetical protein